jgi:hypothetical protein
MRSAARRSAAPSARSSEKLFDPALQALAQRPRLHHVLLVTAQLE